MRMPKVRFTVRRMMVALVFFAIFLHLSVTAWRVYGKGFHLHTSVIIHHNHSASHPNGFPGRFDNFGARVPFWTRYWRCLVGLPSNAAGLCKKDESKLEVCELDHPEICVHPTPNSFSPRSTRRQVELLERLSNPPNSKFRIKFEPSNLDF